MSTPLFLLFGLTVATCIIAYWSDNLGKKLGKKRVTLFGLRPRQTATLITMASSVCIMLFTFVALLTVNSGLRNALLRYEELRETTQQLRSEKKSLVAEQTVLKQQSADARQTAIVALADVKKVRANLQSERLLLAQARLLEGRARQREKAARSGLTQATVQLSAVKNKLGGVEVKLRASGAMLKASQMNLAQARREEGAARKETVEAKRLAVERARELLKDTARLQKETDELQRQQTALQTEVGRLELLKTQLTAIQDGGTVRVFAARTIVARANASEVREQLRAALAEGTIAVRENNAKRTLRLVLPDSKSQTGSEAIIALLAGYIAKFTAPVSVRLTSTRKYAQAETEIEAAFFIVPSKVAFAGGEALATGSVDGTLSDAKIFNQLLRLTNSGEDAARGRGVAPLLKEDEPLYAADTNERIFEVLRRIQAAGTAVTVRLVAADDITTLDQLRVRFEVSQATLPISRDNQN